MKENTLIVSASVTFSFTDFLITFIFLPVFWALQGGGAGSWGVVISATFHTFPTFNATILLVSMIANDNVATGSIIMMHMKHIFDWDDLSMGQYFYTYENTTADAYMLTFVSYFLSISSDEASAAL